MGLQLGSIQTINPSRTLRIFGSHDVGDQSVYVAMLSESDLPAAKALVSACWRCIGMAPGHSTELSNLAVAVAMVQLLGFRHAPATSLAIDLDVAGADIRAALVAEPDTSMPQLSRILAQLSHRAGGTACSDTHAS